jgi:hypothetical protein
LYTGIIYLLTAVCTEAIHFSSVRCISQDFLHAEPVQCSARLEGLCGNSGSIKKNQESRDIQGYYYYSVIITAVQAKSEKAGTFGKHSRYYRKTYKHDCAEFLRALI